MLIIKLQLAAMRRARISEAARKDFWLYVDEFQAFANDSLATILSEGRKYRLGLICANQFLSQLPEPLRDALFGNVGTLISFRVGPQDAELLEPEFWPQFKVQDLINFPNYRAAVKMNECGTPQRPFFLGTLVPSQPGLREGHREKIIRVSRERYGRPRVSVEQRIVRWLDQVNQDFPAGAEVGLRTA